MIFVIDGYTQGEKLHSMTRFRNYKMWFIPKGKNYILYTNYIYSINYKLYSMTTFKHDKMWFKLNKRKIISSIIS